MALAEAAAAFLNDLTASTRARLDAAIAGQKLKSAGLVASHNSLTTCCHPSQDVVLGNDGRPRFRLNAIVKALLDAGPFNMNLLAVMGFSDDDQAQFAQLIGYSTTDWYTLKYVSQSQAREAAALAERLRASASKNASEVETSLFARCAQAWKSMPVEAQREFAIAALVLAVNNIGCRIDKEMASATEASKLIVHKTAATVSYNGIDRGP